MLNFSDAYTVRSKFKKRVSSHITFGHIDKSMFTETEIITMKSETHHDLATQKFSLWGDDEFVKVSIGLWGEDTHLLKDDLGLACVFVDNDAYVLPEHFMSVETMFKFIVVVIEENYPELLI